MEESRIGIELSKETIFRRNELQMDQQCQAALSISLTTLPFWWTMLASLQEVSAFVEWVLLKSLLGNTIISEFTAVIMVGKDVDVWAL